MAGSDVSPPSVSVPPACTATLPAAATPFRTLAPATLNYAVGWGAGAPGMGGNNAMSAYQSAGLIFGVSAPAKTGTSINE